ncbi:hypothetical protein HK101_001753 [Irineochytrium annulatum]|nr:hypothetical protein HK101_001753 [Irineochytrium annulatum]
MEKMVNANASPDSSHATTNLRHRGSLALQTAPLFLTLPLLFLAHVHPESLQSTSLPATLLIVLNVALLGIPHGALDHLLYREIRARSTRHRGAEKQWMSGGRAESENTLVDGEDGASAALVDARVGKWMFYGNYVGIMIAWGLLWSMAPVGAFAIFMALSAFHFGQGDLHHLASRTPIPTVMYLSRGCMLLGALVTSNTDLTGPIISTLIHVDVTDWLNPRNELVQVLAVGQHFVLLQLHAVGILRSRGSAGDGERRGWWVEVGKSVLMWRLFAGMDPLVGFAVYFGTWHSLGSMLDLLRTLKGERLGLNADGKQEGTHRVEVRWRDLLWFWWTAAPYTLVALGSMAAFYLCGGLKLVAPGGGESVRIWSVFVMSISVLTGPHMWIMELIFGASDEQLDDGARRQGFESVSGKEVLNGNVLVYDLKLESNKATGCPSLSYNIATAPACAAMLTDPADNWEAEDREGRLG